MPQLFVYETNANMWVSALQCMFRFICCCGAYLDFFLHELDSPLKHGEAIGGKCKSAGLCFADTKA